MCSRYVGSRYVVGSMPSWGIQTLPSRGETSIQASKQKNHTTQDRQTVQTQESSLEYSAPALIIFSNQRRHFSLNTGKKDHTQQTESNLCFQVQSYRLTEELQDNFLNQEIRDPNKVLYTNTAGIRRNTSTLVG